MIILEDPAYGETKRFKGESEASAGDKAAVGGEKTFTIENVLFQSDADAQEKTDLLLARLKDEKEYSEGTLELCPVPLERRDSVSIEEWISDSKSIWHRGNIRHLKLKVTKTMQTITLIIEE